MRLSSQPHQYIDRETNRVTTEKLIADPLINRLYAGIRENSSLFFKVATSKRMSSILGVLNFDINVGRKVATRCRRTMDGRMREVRKFGKAEALVSW